MYGNIGANPDTGLVAVECQRLTVTLQVAPGGFKIGESGLRTDEQKLHQPTGRIFSQAKVGPKSA